MTLENAKVLHKHLIEIGKKAQAEQLEVRYPELKNEVLPAEPEVKKDGKKSKGRTKRAGNS